MRRGFPLLTVALSALLMLLAGCSGGGSGHGGSGGGSGDSGPTAAAGPSHERYAKLLRECQVVPKPTIAQVVGVSGLVETFSGAVCRWVSADAATAIQLDWFETGTMRTEKDAAQRLGYDVENVRIDGAVSYVIRPPDDPGSCGAVGRAGESGIIGWWVHSAPGDPCEAAKKLLDLSVNRTL